MSFFAPSLASLGIFFIFIRVFSSLLFSVHSTMIQPYFTPQFLGTMFRFVLVCAKCSSLQCFCTFLRVLCSALTQQFSLYVCMYVCVCMCVCVNSAANFVFTSKTGLPHVFLVLRWVLFVLEIFVSPPSEFEQHMYSSDPRPDLARSCSWRVAELSHRLHSPHNPKPQPGYFNNSTIR